MMKTLPALLAIALAPALVFAKPLPSSSPARQDVVPARLATLDATMRRAVDSGEHAGAIWLLARNGRIIHVGTHGHRDLENKLPMQRDTICRIYSMSKIITSVGALALMEDGAFRLDDPVAKHLPELANMRVLTNDADGKPRFVKAAPITIKHLLTHTSGLIYDFLGGDPINQMYLQANLWESRTLAEFTAKVGKLPLKHQPGEAFTYGINTDILGALIERVSGKALGEFLEDRVFAPLAMSDTGFSVPHSKLGRLAKTYQADKTGKLIEAAPLIGVSPEAGRDLETGGAGLFSTADDYARFAQLLINGGTLDGKRILSRKTVELMTANHMVGFPNNSHGFSKAFGFGLGVEVQLDLGRGGVPGSPGTFGWGGAATTYVRIDPKERVVAILFTQHFPFNQHKLFESFLTGVYQALE